MRIALAEGMHTDMPISELGEPTVQRCRKVWWTIYLLDRQMTSLMGIPQSIQDDEMNCRLPSFSGSAQRTAALNTHIKLARIYATIDRSMIIRVPHVSCLLTAHHDSRLRSYRSASQEIRSQHQNCPERHRSIGG